MHRLHGHKGLKTGLLTCGALGALMVAIPVQAQTQTAPPAAEDSGQPTQIVVTGIRKSIAKSISNKRQSDAIIESVTAEDVGKLPGESITDSLSLLPGVTSQRLDGRADILSVRGFGPDFTNTLFNHREIATTGDDRGFQYDQIPSELINRGDVIKTPSATLVGQGLAGTVDLMTIDPLTQSHRILSVSVRGEMDGYGKEDPDVTNTGYRGSVVYVDRFDNDKIGISAGYTILSTPQQEKQYDAWGFPTDAQGNDILGGAKYFATASLEKRQSSFIRLEYRPNSQFELAADGFYSHFTTQQQQRGLEVPMAWGSGTTASNITTVDGFDTQTTFSGVNAVQRNNYNGRDADTLALGLNGKYSFSDRLKLTLDASYSRANRKDTDLETYTGLGYDHAGTPDTITVTQQSNGTYKLNTTLNYDDPAHFVFTDPQAWGYNGVNTVVQAGFLNAPKFVDEIKAVRGDLEGEVDTNLFWGLIKSWDIGANYSDRTKTAEFKSWFLTPGPTLATTSLPIPSDVVVGAVTPFDLGNGQTLALNPLAVEGLLDAQFDNRPTSLARDYVVEEKVATEYAQLNIDGHVGVPVRGNVGLQVVSTDQDSTGSSASLLSVTNPTTGTTTGQVVLLPEEGGAKYTYALPSLNLIFDVADGSVVRAGLARSLSRARQEDMAVPFTYSGSAVPL
jgi:iron complex outermembrane receptor protein